MPPIFDSFQFSFRALLVLTLFNCICFSGVCIGSPGLLQSSVADTTPVSDPDFENDDFVVAVGIENTIRLGKWVPITVTPKHSQKITQVEVQTRDGADVPVNYQSKFESLAAGDSAQALVRFGRKSKSFSLKVFTDDDAMTELIVPLVDTRTLLSVQPLILTFEREPQITLAINGDLAARSADDNRRVAKQVLDYSQLPDSWLAYDAVETILIATNDTLLLSELSEKQVTAIEGWVRHGGRLIISASPEHSEDWFGSNKPLAQFAPSAVKEIGQFKNSSRLEDFVKSSKQLLKSNDPPIETVVIEPSLAKVWVIDEDKKPLIVQHAMGLGTIVFVAFDLKNPAVVAWPSYSVLIRVLVEGKSTARGNSQSISTLGGSVVRLGFTDLVGQLFAPMEQFSKVQFVPFTAIAILIGLYILCIGPLDYFLLRNVFKRMELTWITFPLFSLLFCGLAVGISLWSRPHALQANQLEIIDIDATDSSCRGFVWTNFYSPTGDSLDVQMPSKNSLDLSINESMTSWHGQPGDGLGGMNGGSAAAATTPAYTQSVGLNPISSQLKSFPIPVSSSRAVFTNWKARSPLQIRSNLTFRKEIDEIVGTFKNPLNQELVNCRLYHGNWAYVLEGPLAAGDVVDIATETTSKRIEGILNRKQVNEDNQNRTYATHWDLAEMNVGRIAEMMMFYEIAGGNNYTGLSHDYQGRTDMSDLLTSQRAILVGEIKGQVSQLEVTEANPHPVAPEYDQVTTFVRIVLPVSNARRRTRR